MKTEINFTTAKKLADKLDLELVENFANVFVFVYKEFNLIEICNLPSVVNDEIFIFNWKACNRADGPRIFNDTHINKYITFKNWRYVEDILKRRINILDKELGKLNEYNKIYMINQKKKEIEKDFV